MNPKDFTAAQPVRRRVRIVNPLGLHARAAGKFVKLAGTFDARVTVSRNESQVSGLSIMGLLMLAASPGVEIELTAEGPQAAAVVAALAKLVERRFHED